MVGHRFFDEAVKFPRCRVGFNLTIPLSNKSQQAEYSRVVSVKQSNEAQRTALAQQIALEVRNALSAVEMNKLRITAAQRTLTLAEKQLEALVTYHRRLAELNRVVGGTVLTAP